MFFVWIFLFFRNNFFLRKRSTCNSKCICFNTSMHKSNSGSQESGTTLPKSSHTGRFQLLGGGSAVKKESLSEFDSDNSDDQLVVDETPRKRKRENKSASTIKPGSLKLKLSGLYIVLFCNTLVTYVCSLGSRSHQQKLFPLLLLLFPSRCSPSSSVLFPHLATKCFWAILFLWGFYVSACLVILDFRS